jgi:N-acetylneuraminate synthase/N,N'-diacetyllegionaminate synthase
MENEGVQIVSIGKRAISPGRPSYVIAEIGLNHNGDMELGARTIAAAAAAGADAVKFQNYRTEDFLLDRTLTHRYRLNGVDFEEPQFDMFKRYELDRERLTRFKQVCVEHGIDLISTPTSKAGIDDLVAVDAPALKNGSDFLGNLPLIEEMARTGLPTILSVGMATLAEIDEAVQAFYGAGGGALILLHCVSLYPAPAAELHLRKIPAMAATFGCPIGYSDHSLGTAAAVAAVTLGACVIEKHFTLDRELPGPDHAMSSNPAEMAELVRALRDTEAALADAPLGFAAGEAAARDEHRLSCVAARDLEAGHRLQESDIVFRRPGTGLRPALSAGLVNRRLNVAASPGHVLQWSDIA